MAWSRADSACLRELRRADVRAKRARPRETGMGLEFWSRLSRRGVINWLTDGAGGRGVLYDIGPWCAARRSVRGRGLEEGSGFRGGV